MGDPLGIGPSPREFSLGASFGNSKNCAFHTIRYDFKPASVDVTKMATVDIGQSNQVSVSVPHVEGSGTNQTIFKGSRKPYQKEFVFVIDHNSGDITLERLSNNIQLKKTRSEGNYKSMSTARPITPIDKSNKVSPVHKLSPSHLTSSHKNAQSPSISRSSPLHQSPAYPSSKSPMNSKLSPPYSNKSNGVKAGSVPGSMPIIGEFAAQEEDAVGVLSDSSSDSSVPSDSGSDSESESPPTPAQSPPAREAGNNLSMPSMLLNDDLHLSEDSGSE